MTVAIIIYIFICALLIGLILLQQNQSGGLGILGGSSNTVLGSAQEDVISKIIKFLAFLFITSAIFLSIMSADKKSVLDDAETPVNPDQQIDEIIQNNSNPTDTQNTPPSTNANPTDEWLKLDNVLQQQKPQEQKQKQQQNPPKPQAGDNVLQPNSLSTPQLDNKTNANNPK